MKRQITLLLISISLIAVSLVLYSAELENRDFGGPGHHKAKGFENAPLSPPPPHMIGILGLFKLADELEITNPQLLQLRLFFQKNCKTMKGVGPRHLLHKKLSDPTLKEEDVKKIAAEEGKAIEKSILAKFQMMQDLKKILTPEQFKKLHELRPRGHKPLMDRPGFEPPPEVGPGPRGMLDD